MVTENRALMAARKAEGANLDIRIRRANAKEATILTSISRSSKAIWGYDDDFMEQCRNELTVTAEYVSRREVYIAELGGQSVGFYGLTVDASRPMLDFLYVAPKFLRQGIGRKLWNHLIETAMCFYVTSLFIDADPHAEDFYLSMGAERIGTTPSGSIEGRFLPLMRVTIF